MELQELAQVIRDRGGATTVSTGLPEDEFFEPVSLCWALNAMRRGQVEPVFDTSSGISKYSHLKYVSRELGERMQKRIRRAQNQDVFSVCEMVYGRRA